jgi:hypothetical protein
MDKEEYMSFDSYENKGGSLPSMDKRSFQKQVVKKAKRIEIRHYILHF